MKNALPNLTAAAALEFTLASAIGRRRMPSLQASGLPAVLHEPLNFLVRPSVSAADAGVVEVVEGLRSAMMERDQRVDFYSESKPATLRTLRKVGQVSSVLPAWGVFLYLCAKARAAETILELGGAAGISGCYLASSRACRRFVTIEGSESRGRLARAHLAQVAPHAEVIIDTFQRGLDR